LVLSVENIISSPSPKVMWTPLALSGKPVAGADFIDDDLATRLNVSPVSSI
jgi:hypothetical protein